MGNDLWNWAVENGFDELKEFAEDVCSGEICKELAKEGGLKNFIERGMSLDVLDKVVCKAAKVMVEHNSR